MVEQIFYVICENICLVNKDICDILPSLSHNSLKIDVILIVYYIHSV